MARDVWPGQPHTLGAKYDGDGVNFAIFSRVATRVEVQLFDPSDPTRPIESFDLRDATCGVFHGYVPGLRPGALYGVRVHGSYEPEWGARCNPNKLLVDPHARAITGVVDWTGPVFGYVLGDANEDLTMCERDSAAAMPKSVVVDETFDWGDDRPPRIPWRSSVVYELHVRGFTKLHPEVPEPLRGTYLGLAHPAVISHLRRLGVTAVELLPVHEASNEGFLQDKGLSNYWGYSTLGYFAPSHRYAADQTPGAAVREFKQMVKALHAAGIEVILDVVYNHTCEGNHLGPTLSLRGIDNASYYWLMPEPRYYLDFTGTGNSLNASNPPTARLIADSLRYWADEMRVDGFRFDLASTVGRTGKGAFDKTAPIFQIISQDPVLSRTKLIAEPWDCGTGGYQVGGFPAPWREWNGKYRDAIRGFWKGDDNPAGEIGYRIAGSDDLYPWAESRSQASINFVTAHDGFTLRDLVTYDHKHNEANGEDNRDGGDDNRSWNHGVEGETDDPTIVALRERQQRNLLATLMVSQGVPMMTAGDEMGRTQRGNNNAYCQDNELSWVDWQLDDRKRALLEFTRKLIAFRHAQPVLQRRRNFRGDFIWDARSRDLVWYLPDGTEMDPEDWQQPFVRSFAFTLGGDADPVLDERGRRIAGDPVLVLINAHWEATRFKLPPGEHGPAWLLVADTNADAAAETRHEGEYEVTGRAMAVFRQPR